MSRSLTLLMLMGLGVGAGCGSTLALDLGATVPAAELREVPSLARRAAEHFERGEDDLGFYVLEALKTRDYAEVEDEGASTDLRPVFAEVLSHGGDARELASRGLVLTSSPRPSEESTETARDATFWTQQGILEERLDANLPEAMAMRYTIGIATSEQARLLFSPTDRFVSFLVEGDRIWAAVVSTTGLHVLRLDATVSDVRRALTSILDALRSPTSGDAWRAPAHELHTMLIAPLGEDVASAEVLYVSPHRLLASVPWSVLVDDDGTPAIERGHTTLLVSASVHRAMLGRPLLEEPPRLLAIGNPTYPEGVAELPAAEEEALAVGRVYGGARVLLAEAATESAVADEIDGANILHFATHGVLLGRAVPGASSLLLAADDREDGFLSAREIATKDLSHLYIAMLSACETSVSEDAAADLTSLTGAFLIAGTPTVVGSLWQVSDEATTRLMLRFYAAFLEQGAGPALRQAQLSLRSTPAFEHPFYWAAFVLYGWDR